ncbi:aldehyde-activating protein [Mesorhizobium sp. L-8-10]|uniref:GFA family protein n=1 Tax=Mesorhizobium sp. L-8-10 TaxID=2744523 RepID=UPI001928AE78|nr:GFA family protein [Mesorhizobium sp. L-8-10]BCH28306.1 aldehyde-activating protein [Mesorhizobium sp. L-8-10]
MVKGSCHCGNVAFDVEGEPGSVIECNCSHCSRKGYLLWFVPRDKLTLHTPPEALATYKFNKHFIDHLFCRNCGCAPFGFGVDPKGREMASINVRCIEEIDLSTLQRIPFDGRSR